MDLNEIEKLLELMVEVEYENPEAGSRLKLRKAEPAQAPSYPMLAPTMALPAQMDGAMLASQFSGPPPAPAPAAPSAAELERANLTEVLSPMVGTFYRAASPESDTFVEVGDTIDEESVVCIIEAMKVMNEIKAEVAGEVVEILVENGEAVEFGQPLLLIRTE
jgi:acetyl-CoA carboxylase biotin carboxyl carrier protein